MCMKAEYFLRQIIGFQTTVRLTLKNILNSIERFSVGCIKPIGQQVTLYTVLYRMAPHRMKAKRATSFVAKSPFHPRRSKQPIFPVPVNALEIEFTDPKSAQKSNPASTNIILEKIGICSVRVHEFMCSILACFRVCFSWTRILGCEKRTVKFFPLDRVPL